MKHLLLFGQHMANYLTQKGARFMAFFFFAVCSIYDGVIVVLVLWDRKMRNFSIVSSNDLLLIAWAWKIKFYVMLKSQHPMINSLLQNEVLCIKSTGLAFVLQLATRLYFSESNGKINYCLVNPRHPPNAAKIATYFRTNKQTCTY